MDVLILILIGFLPISLSLIKTVYLIKQHHKSKNDAWLRENEVRRKKRIAEEERRKQEQERERQKQEEQHLRDLERERQKLEKQRIADEKRRQQGENIPAHKLMAAEQRRLMSASLRYDILVRDGFRCKICGASAQDGVKLHVDHIIPVSKGGKTEKSNLRTLCERCNLGKGDKIESIPVPSATVQRAVPVQPVILPQPAILEPEESFEEIQNLSMNEAVQILNAFGIRYVDNTDRGGCFWIELNSVSEVLLHDKTIDGKKICTANHSKAFSNAPALYVK